MIYVGPMGCLTGFYLLTRGLTDAEALALTQESFAWMAEYDGDIPGASAVECGNYLMMDPVAARLECKAMSEVLQSWMPTICATRRSKAPIAKQRKRPKE